MRETHAQGRAQHAHAGQLTSPTGQHWHTPWTAALLHTLYSTYFQGPDSFAASDVQRRRRRPRRGRRRSSRRAHWRSSASPSRVLLWMRCGPHCVAAAPLQHHQPAATLRTRPAGHQSRGGSQQRTQMAQGPVVGLRVHRRVQQQRRRQQSQRQHDGLASAYHRSVERSRNRTSAAIIRSDDPAIQSVICRLY